MSSSADCSELSQTTERPKPGQASNLRGLLCAGTQTAQRCSLTSDCGSNKLTSELGTLAEASGKNMCIMQGARQPDQTPPPQVCAADQKGVRSEQKRPLPDE